MSSPFMPPPGEEPNAVTVTVTTTVERKIRMTEFTARDLAASDGLGDNQLLLTFIAEEKPGSITNMLLEHPAATIEVGTDWCVELHTPEGKLIKRVSR
jgi:hypothetical protein